MFQAHLASASYLLFSQEIDSQNLTNSVVGTLFYHYNFLFCLIYSESDWNY